MYFTKPIGEYERDFDFTNNYRRQMVTMLMRFKGIDYETAEKFVGQIIAGIDTSNLTMHHTVRNQHGDRSMVETNLLDYLKKISDAKLGMSPTLTTYLRPDQKASLVGNDIANNMAMRKIVKREGQLAGQAGDTVVATIKNGRQNTIKRGINSWSGASLDKHNTFHCPSLHPSLTTMCRISTALATASVEKFLGGIRYYHTPEKVIEDIMAIVDSVDSEQIERTMIRHNLVYPTLDMAMEVVKRSTDYYWWDEEALNTIRSVLGKLSPEEVAAFCYDGDLYHLFKFNYKYIHKTLTELASFENLADCKTDRMGELGGDEFTLISNLLGPLIGGTPLGDAIKEKPEVAKLANDVANNILNGLAYISDIVKTFWCVKHFPLNVGAQNHAIRLSVPLGDTDSTIFTTKHINELYFGEAKFDEEQEPVADVIVYMVNGIIAHALANFTAQLGIVKENRSLIIMKNEFKFPGLQLTPVAKTYHAYVKACEGLVYNKAKFELKGARYHAGKANVELIGELHKLMEDNLTNLNKGIKIDRGELIDIILRVEVDIIDSISRTNDVYFKRERIKPKEEFKKPDSSVYAYHTLWNEMFGKEYGKAPDPTYYAYKVDIDYSQGTQSFLDALTPAQRNGIERWRTTHKKDSKAMPTAIYIPMDNFARCGVPKEIREFVNIRKVAAFTLDAHYLNLSSMGIIRNKLDNQWMLSDMIEPE